MHQTIYEPPGPPWVWWLLAAVNAAAVVVAVVQAFRLDRRSPHRFFRRLAIRSGWPSYCRSAGLAVTKDKRRVVTMSSGGGPASPSLWSVLDGSVANAKPRPSRPATTTVRYEPVERLPRIGHGRATASRAAVTYQLRPARGGSLDDVADRADQLAAAMQVHQVTVERVRPDRGRLVVTLDDQLSRPRPWPGPRSGVGVTQTGDQLRMPLLGGHYLLAGVTGSGKSAWLNALLADLVTSGVPRHIVGVDPKVVELAAWEPALGRLVVDPGEVGPVLAALHSEVTDRYRRLAVAGARKLAAPTDDMPLLALVIDELGEIARQGPGEDRDAPKERLRLLASLAAVGRGAGLVIIAATQRPSAQLIGSDLRSNLTRRVCCRVSDEHGAEAVLGPDARKLAPWRIDPAAPGVAWVVSEEHRHPQLARSYWLDDDHVAAIAAACPAPRPVELEEVR